MQKTHSTTENTSVSLATTGANATGENNDTTTTNATTSTENTNEQATVRFADLGLNGSVLEKLDRLGFVTPTPIQAKAIPIALTGKDITGIAQTGTGKTLAFGLPMLQRFIEGKGRIGRGLIILPTRELAIQVEEVLQQIGRSFGLKTAVLIGGAPIYAQRQLLSRNPDIIVATPGRLIDHLQSRNVDLRTVDVLVLDEADRMLDMGFAPQIKQILREVPEDRQTMLFSATMPSEIVTIAANYMRNPQRIEIERAGTTASQVTQELFVVSKEGKNDLLSKLLYDYKRTVLVFARTRSGAHRVARVVREMGHRSAEIHSDRSLSQRREALDGFKTGKYRVLIATDIAARGIDVTGIELVVNYDLPDCADDYVHRIGRTGRAGETGHAVSFATPDQASDVRDIEKSIRAELPMSENSPLQLERLAAPARRGSSRRGNGGYARPNNANRAGSYRGGSGGSSTRSNGDNLALTPAERERQRTSQTRSEAPKPRAPHGLNYSSGGSDLRPTNPRRKFYGGEIAERSAK